MRVHVLLLVAVAGPGLAGCGGGTAHHGAAATASAGVRAGAGTASGVDPLPVHSAGPESEAATCAGVTYRVTGGGVEVTARVAATPVTLNFEADDRDDNPVTGDPRTSGADYAFRGTDTRRTLTIEGVRSLDHLTVIALNTGRDDSCRAVRR